MIEVFFGIGSGYLLGSALKDADAHFKLKERRFNNDVSFLKPDNDEEIIVKYQKEDSLYTIFLKAAFEPLIPTGCNSFSDLSKYLTEDSSRGTRVKASLGGIWLFGVSAYKIKTEEAWGCAAIFLASAYLATGYFRDNTDLGFYVNPIGVTFKKIGEVTGLNRLFTSKGHTIGENPKGQDAFEKAQKEKKEITK